ncbi:MAG: sulfatase [Rikenellaceae bacterium]
MKRPFNIALLSGVALGAASCSEGVSEKPLNILLINIDDLGWSDLTFQGSTFYETPNIDKLRSEGVFFDNGYAAAANSAPSRSSMLTGVYAPRHGVYTVNPADRGKAKDRKLISAENREFPRAEFELISERLQANGYNTCQVGKWHLGDDSAEQGFDLNIGGYAKGHPDSYFSPYNNPHLTDGEDGEFLTDRITTEAIKFLESGRDKSKPFFLYYATYAVHTPIQPKPELVGRYEEKEANEAHYNAKYAALIESMDQNVGRLLEALRETGEEDNTVIIFTTDNGGLYSVSKQWPLRAGKGSFYEGGIRVPFIVKWNGHTTPNTTNHTPVSQMDLYPTILSLTGVTNEGLVLDGVDICEMIVGKRDIDERSIYWHFPAYLEGGNSECTDSIFRSRPVSVVRRGDWKLIHNYESGINELYNIKDDISEKSDLAKVNKAMCDQLYGDLQAWLKSVDAPCDFKLNPKYQGE